VSGRANPARGRFRNFLLRILVRFLSDLGPARAPRQQTFEQQLVSVESLLGEEERRYEPPAHETPESVFMKQWAAGLVHRVCRELREWCREQGRPLDYEGVEAAHAAPEAADTSQRALANQFGVSRDRVRAALKQTRRHFAALLRSAVRDEVDAEEEVGAEIGELMDLLGR
jgi:hypothetical protein